ncbi:alpha/beta fold hydrolase [Rhodococcus sp. BP-252]|nr:alpha/beta fold hydrolase [Rhodococcus sp. BP-320]MBY6415431.1 alpha/beta fold hydrolase [Rhodococcus sp. BP-321]MBY6420046.1 alpha/beta fold hydrolase [Rhodococcus sp. BP-324]MBY6425300.1 alpha/beta fold hydrolase [Rhodococcus sp. BP-323]MBY6430637.1 alpha/beta fold hydrolase [Rhodococcus sp. BP-322]MBY6439485.1 alpha/beta fold hydrolase [Rhodococcus sp. BP-319]MBY6444474.1 alpha/beta fold hydrolase [Rhodococcus sp. BP-318]MBY6449158.1 alpha/beta fold hydrolase [Rhodococcus sp. BP-315]M
MRLLYGPDADNVGDLYLPDNNADSLPVVVMVHGGGWQKALGSSYFAPISQAVADQGIAVWNIEYRRGTGNWADTLADVDNATEALATSVQEAAGGRLDLDRVHVAGHSAGGQLAAWLAGRHTLPASAPGAQPRVMPKSATIMAGVYDMARAATIGGDRFVPAFLGGMPDQVPDRYRVASPIDHLPIDVRVSALHGDSDKTVSVNQSTAYVDAARAAGDPAELTVLPGVGHDDFVHSGSVAWTTAVDTITEHAATLD